ncbi:hypothetical protein [Desulfuromonas acetoxidans]|nr:hypothetical protein [Desulfuromonas acetoxidans]
MTEGWAPATRFTGATEKIKRAVSMLSTFYAKADDAHDSPT